MLVPLPRVDYQKPVNIEKDSSDFNESRFLFLFSLFFVLLLPLCSVSSSAPVSQTQTSLTLHTAMVVNQLQSLQLCVLPRRVPPTPNRFSSSKRYLFFIFSITKVAVLLDAILVLFVCFCDSVFVVFDYMELAFI